MIYFNRNLKKFNIDSEFIILKNINVRYYINFFIPLLFLIYVPTSSTLKYKQNNSYY